MAKTTFKSPEPSCTGVLTNLETIQALNYFNITLDSASKKANAIKYAKTIGFIDAHKLSSVTPEHLAHVGNVATLALKGADLSFDFHDKYKCIVSRWYTSPIERVKPTRPPENHAINKAFTLIDSAIDAILNNAHPVDISKHKYAVTELRATDLTEVKEYLDITVQEMADEANAEYFALPIRQRNKINNLVDEYKVFIREATPVRKSTVRKPASAERQVKHIKYQAKSALYDIKGLTPDKLIGSTAAILFNEKTKQVIRWVTNKPSGFWFKGATVQDLDVALSVRKTLRKPQEQLKEIIKPSISRTNGKFNSVKTKEYEASPRIGSGVMILAVYR